MSEISTKAGVFETGKKDEFGVAYQGNRLISCSNKSLTEYSVREGTEVICDRAFMNAKDLRSIQLPKSIRAIGESAFAGCKSLQDINIPEGVTEIRQSTFRDCKSLGCLELPASCIKIDKWAFSDGLETLVCNAPSMQIDKSAFFGCKTLSTVMVPEGSDVPYAQALMDCRLTPDIEEMPTADSNETPCESDTINNANQKDMTMEEKKMEDPILGTTVFDAEGRPVVSLTFKMYYLNGDEDSADAFMESKSEGLGIFVAVGSNKPSAEPFKDYLFMAPVEAFYEGYYAYKDEDPDGAADLLNRGLVMYACTEDECDNEPCEAALELIFGEDNPENYNGPEAIFKIKVVDGDANDEDMKDYCIRVYQNENGKWTSEELDN